MRDSQPTSPASLSKDVEAGMACSPLNLQVREIPSKIVLRSCLVAEAVKLLKGISISGTLCSCQYRAQPSLLMSTERQPPIMSKLLQFFKMGESARAHSSWRTRILF